MTDAEARRKARHTAEKALRDIDIDECESAIKRFDGAKALLEGNDG